MRVYRRRHGHRDVGEKEFDAGETDDNPMYSGDVGSELVTVALSQPGPVDLHYEQVETSEDGCAIKLVEGGYVAQHHPELRLGMFLTEVAGHSVEGLELEAVRPLLAEVSEGVELTLVFSSVSQ